MNSEAGKMATANETCIAGEISDDLEAMDAARIAHRLGGIVANDSRIRDAIQAALDNEPNEQGILAAVANALAK
jgi:hypothetical protein